MEGIRVTMAGILALVSLSVIVAGCHRRPWGEGSIQETKFRAQTIINAIDRYYKVNGKYPHTLETLVPNYLNELPMPVAGDGRWRYGVVEKGPNPWNVYDYDLAFQRDDYGPVWIYDGSSRKWWLDTR